MKRAKVTITGTSPLLMHAFPMTPPPKPIEKMEPREQAEYAAYRDTEGYLYLPGVAVQRAIVQGASYVKGKGRGSLQKPIAACVIINEMQIPLGLKDYVIDSRPVVVPATKGRIIRHRPRLDKWAASFSLTFDDSLVTANQLREAVDNTGSRVGLLDFRPEKKGPFGRFIVTEWGVE